MGKADIIADCQAEADTTAFGKDQPVAGGKMIRFTIAPPVADIGIEHVDLVIGGADAAVTTDHHRAVHNPRIQPPADEYGPDKKIDGMLRGNVRQLRQRAAVIRPFGLGLQRLARGGKKGGGLGKTNQSGTGSGGAVDHRDQPCQRFLRRAGGAILQRRDPKLHRLIACHAANIASSLPAPSRAYSSWHPPTCVPSMKICGTEVRPLARARISARRFELIETSICL